jgi:hypothetical protein
MKRALWLAAFAASLAVSCGVGGDDARAQLALRSTQWLTADTARGYALTQNANLAVGLRITNNQMTALSLSTNHFVLGTTDGYNYTASPVTTMFPGGCNASASVQPGATVDCFVLFSFAGPRGIASVAYEFENKGTSSVNMSVPACTLCGAWCTDLNSDLENCGACGKAVPDGAACSAGKPTCSTGLTACGTQCINTLTDPNNCGGCGKQVYGGTCTNGAPSCGWGSEFCNGGCTLTAQDPGNCGRCGAQCPSTYACIDSQCACPPGHAVCGNGCKDLQYDENNCGTCGKTCQSGYSCSQGSCVYGSGGSGGSGGGSGGCHVNCSQFGLSCCGSSCC